MPVSRLLFVAVAPLAVATVAGLVLLWPSGETLRSESLGPPAELVDAVVVSDEQMPCEGGPSRLASACHLTTVRITEGLDAGLERTLEMFEGPGQPRLEAGDPIVLGRTADAGGVEYYFADFQRRIPLVWLAVLFAAVVVAVGRIRGLAALGGLVVTFLLLIEFVLPAVLEGSSPLAVAIVGSAAMMFVLLYLAHGFNSQTTTALLGTLVSLVLTGLLAALFVDAGRLISVGTEETAFLQVSAAQVNLQGLLLGSIIIGSLGVLNDVTVTQASAVWALRSADPTAGPATLYRSAMRIGRDHIASTVDTLVLAYAGASLPLLLLFTLASRPLADVITGELVAQEIVRTMVGGIGLAASVPLTTGLAALVAGRGEVPAPMEPPPPADTPEEVPPDAS